MVLTRKFWGKPIVNMRRIAKTGQKDDNAAATSPIYNFDPDVAFNFDELDLWRSIGFSGWPNSVAAVRDSVKTASAS